MNQIIFARTEGVILPVSSFI